MNVRVNNMVAVGLLAAQSLRLIYDYIQPTVITSRL